MTAAYLDAVLNADGERNVDIALLESPDVPRIGVGEATIPSITHILSVIGIDEIEFLKRVEGTYKQAIKYVDWLHGSHASLLVGSVHHTRRVARWVRGRVARAGVGRRQFGGQASWAG